MGNRVKDFNEYRTRMNEVILSKNNLVMKRLWNLDTNTYEDGALDKRPKNFWVWWPVWCCVVMIALITI